MKKWFTSISQSINSHISMPLPADKFVVFFFFYCTKPDVSGT